jgi:hypothetical protein
MKCGIIMIGLSDSKQSEMDTQGGFGGVLGYQVSSVIKMLNSIESGSTILDIYSTGRKICKRY